MKTKQHKPNRWHVDCHLEHVAGLVSKRRHYTDQSGLVLTTKKEAESYALVLAKGLGRLSGNQRRTFGDAVVAWENEQQQRVVTGALSLATSKDDISRVRKHICSWKLNGVTITDVRLHSITTVSLRDALLRNESQLTSSQLSNPVKRKLLRRLKSIFAVGVVEGWISHNPAAALTLALQKEDPLSKALDTKVYSNLARDLPAILEVLESWAILPLKTIRSTGLRIGELRALSLEQVEDNRLCIDRAIKSDGSVGKPKTGLTRYIPLPPSAINELREHAVALGLRNSDPLFPYNEDQIRNAFYKAQFAARGLVFARASNNHTTRRTYKVDDKSCDTIEGAFKAARLTQFGLHSLRHLYASELFAGGRPLSKVAQRLVDSEQVTRKYYIHWIDDSDDYQLDLKILKSVGAY